MSLEHPKTAPTVTHWITNVALSLLLIACAAPQPAPEASLEPPYELVINGVVDSALDDLIMQMRRLPAFAPTFRSLVQQAPVAVEKNDMAVPPRTVIAVDRSVGKSGQPTAANEVFDALLLETARQKLAQFEIIGANPILLNQTQYVLGGTLTPLDAVSTSRGTFRVDLLLTELKTSYIVAQTSVRFTAQGVDLKPLWCCITH